MKTQKIVENINMGIMFETRGETIMTCVNSGDELTEISSGHLWEVTGETLKGGLLHYKLNCKQPGRVDANLVLCESGLFLRFKPAANSADTKLFSFTRLRSMLK